MLNKIRGWYACYAHGLSYLQHPLLLAMRVYWGWTFVHSGYGKLTHLEVTAQKFAAWGIPMPDVNAVMAGTTECVGGALLIAGLASRIVALPLIVVMIVAYCTAHRADVTDLYSFTTAPPFLNLLTCVIVLVFGPGSLSLDGLLSHCCRKPQPADAGPAETPLSDLNWFSRTSTVLLEKDTRMNDSSANDSLTPITTRRDFHKLALAALGGAVAGTLPGCRGQPAKPPPDGKGADDKGAKDPATGGKSADSKSPEKPATTDENLLLAGDPHVCRGLNQCKGQGKGKDNACAGQGACASAEKHSCDGMNACKGQGGCGEHPGQNQCNGQGACAVPLKDNTWTKARKKFEELMAKKGKTFGPAPEKA